MPFDISNDWVIVDGVQTISYRSRTGDGPEDFAGPYTATALKRENHKRDIIGSAGAALQRLEANWNIWASSQSVPFVPKKGDKFTADGVTGTKTWLVLDCDYCDFTTRYRLRCKQHEAE